MLIDCGRKPLCHLASIHGIYVSAGISTAPRNAVFSRSLLSSRIGVGTSRATVSCSPREVSFLPGASEAYNFVLIDKCLVAERA